jgi:hypothetical protein
MAGALMAIFFWQFKLGFPFFLSFCSLREYESREMRAALTRSFKGLQFTFEKHYGTYTAPGQPYRGTKQYYKYLAPI